MILKDKSRAIIALVTSALLFGSTFAVVKDLISDLTPVNIVFLRYLLAAILFLITGGIPEKEYLNSQDQIKTQKLQYITPLVGLEFNGFVFAYTYSYQSNSVVFDNGGYHQLTLGFNFGCRKQRYDCNCPWIK